MGKMVVVKLGTSVLTAGSRSLNRAHMLSLVQQMVHLRTLGHTVVLVTSGAIAAGRDYLHHPDLPKTIASKQMLASVGQTQLMNIWSQLFDIYGVKVGQILVSRADMEDRERFLYARDTLSALLEQGIVPIVNENDAVAAAEIKVGDNDNLSALIAILAGAKQLYLLTDQQGLFNADPRSNPEAQLIAEVPEITLAVRQMAGGSVSGLGTGGMMTKIIAADVATRSGIETIIADGMRTHVLVDLAQGMAIGTKFLVPKHLLDGRKQWLFAAPVAGKLVIDEGAVKALLEQQKSLLPAGVKQVVGTFSRGEVLSIEDEKGRVLARAMVRYGSEALQRISGAQSSDIEKLLGYAYGSVVVHRDDMVLL